MIENYFSELYEKFNLNFYGSIFNTREENSDLSVIEAICLELIKVLGSPTISEMTEFMNVSQPNMTYRISSLVDKGYVIKVQSKDDKREFFLKLTDKFWDYDRRNKEYIAEVASRMRKRFEEKDIKKAEEMLKVTSSELMYELNRYLK